MAEGECPGCGAGHGHLIRYRSHWGCRHCGYLYELLEETEAAELEDGGAPPLAFTDLQFPVDPDDAEDGDRPYFWNQEG